MKQDKMRHRWAKLVIVAVWLAGLVGLVGTPQRAAAWDVGCRTDPVVILADGTFVDLGARIQTTADNVQSVVYTLHAPSGSRVVRVIHLTPGINEIFQLAADTPASQYWTDTIVNTAVSGVNVTAFSVVLPAGGSLRYGRASGQDHQDLIINLAP